MRLDITVITPPLEGEEFMSEITAMVEFTDPGEYSLISVFQTNFDLKDKLEKHYDIKVDIQHDQDSVTIVLLETEDDENYIELLEDMRASLINDLEALKFKVENFSMLFMEHRVQEEYLPSVNKELLN